MTDTSSRPKGRTKRFESPHYRSHAAAQKVNISHNLFCDARRVLEGWCDAKMALYPTAEEGKTELALMASITPLCKDREELGQMTRHLADALKEYDMGGNFKIKVQIYELTSSRAPEAAPRYQCRVYLVFDDQSRSLPAQKKLAEYKPELLIALQEVCHMPDEVVPGRAH